ncbi:membrane protein [Capnocytophaga sp. HP1101]
MKKLVPHVVIIALFAVIALAFFYPVLQGKGIFQSDIVQYTGMAKERNDYRETENKETYWTNSAFGGMPTYQLGAQYPNDFIKQLDRTLRFLPRPADYLFLYFVGFYVLLLVLKVDYKNAFLGAIAFGLSTYLIIILGAGHNAKAHAIAYFAPVLAGILLVFQRKYLWGGLLTAVALALELCANHFQMTYYLLLLVLLLGLGFLYKAIKEKQLRDFGKATAVLIGAVVVSVLANATLLLTTREYADWSTRSKSTLSITPEGTPKVQNSGLSKEYITEYSYGIGESLNLIVPRLFGGSNHEDLGENSKTYQYLVQMGVPPMQALQETRHLPTYWGDQPIVAAPAYIGAVVFFLFVLALFVVKGRIKWWLIAGSVMALLLSWGKNFGLLTDFMIDYFPLYNKFRAVSSIQVILELCVPILAIIGLQQFLKTPEEERKKYLLNTLYICLGVMLLLFLGKGFFDFQSANDVYYGNREIVQMIVEDRKSIYTADLLRSTVLILLTALALVLYQYNKIPLRGMQVALLLLLFFDLGGVAKRYVNKDSFVDKYQIENPFEATPADMAILQDKSYYRVHEPQVGINGARTSYFHHSIGGYHAAKPKRLQELFDYQIAKGNMEMLNMLNVKYIILRNQEGQIQPIHNEDALGNAWFVKQLSLKNNDDEVMQALKDFHPAEEALATLKDLKTALPTQYAVDSTATIALKHMRPDELTYESNNSHEGFAVFSEMYYPHGWKATIDGKEAPIYRVDYTLRGMTVPAGKHEIRFAFEPEIVKTGSRLSLVGGILLLLWLAGGIFVRFKK